MKSTDNKVILFFLYLVQLLLTGMTKIHIVICKITIRCDILSDMICISVKNNVL